MDLFCITECRLQAMLWQLNACASTLFRGQGLYTHIVALCPCREDFLRQTEYGYGEENLGADDLSELRAAADGHGPYAKYN